MSEQRTIIARNRKAHYQYAIEEVIEAGIVLQGSEVKSLREGKASIEEAHAGEMNGELYLFNSHIQEYLQANRMNHSPTRPRKLLIHKKEWRKLLGKIKIKGYTLIPTVLYFNHRNRVKIELGLGRGKKLHDKRETLKQKEWERDKARTVRGKNEQ